MATRRQVRKRKPSAYVSHPSSRKREESIRAPPPLLDTFAAIRGDLDIADGLAIKLVDGEMSDSDIDFLVDDPVDALRKTAQKLVQVLQHIKSEASRIEEELHVYGEMQGKWQAYKVGKRRTPARLGRRKLPETEQPSQSIVRVSSFCKNAKGGSVEFSRVQVPLPHPSMDGLKMHVCKKLKLDHPTQIRVMKETRGAKGAGRCGRAELKDDDPLCKPKVAYVADKNGMPKLQLHYPLRVSVSPSSVQLLVLEVVACLAWKDKDSKYEAIEESVRANLSAMLKDVAQSHSNARAHRKPKMMLNFSWVGKGGIFTDTLLEEEYGWWHPRLQMKDVSKRGTALLETDGGELGVAILAGGDDLRSLQEAAKKQTTKVTLSEAFSGKHLFDLTVMSSDSVIDIGTKVKKRLREPSELKFVNGVGQIIEGSVKANGINSYKAPKRPLADAVQAQPVRVLKLEVRQTATVGRASPKTKAKAKAKAKSTVKEAKTARKFAASTRKAQPATQSAPSLGLVFIDQHPDRAIVLTKNHADAQKLVELLAQHRPEFPMYDGRGSLIELYQMSTVAEMLGTWSREKHLVQDSGSFNC